MDSRSSVKLATLKREKSLKPPYHRYTQDLSILYLLQDRFYFLQGNQTVLSVEVFVLPYQSNCMQGNPLGNSMIGKRSLLHALTSFRPFAKIALANLEPVEQFPHTLSPVSVVLIGPTRKYPLHSAQVNLSMESRGNPTKLRLHITGKILI
ncbi:hypothetical protein QE152_g35803 [Popillia japonica]|uniref:Uncharacterized protein n=1 Tax=Popillia japonica TaxID=7064 RepID=A0AAW1IE84_POPJA